MKKLDMSVDDRSPVTSPAFATDAETLAAVARGLSHDDLRSLMSISPALAELNAERFAAFGTQPVKAAALAFAGDTYQGLQAGELSEDDMAFAQRRLRILSGLYGLLRPLDRIQPYRLEMGSRFATRRAKNLYEFWGEQLTDTLNDDLASASTDILINLASNEYFKAVKPKLLNADVITPQFKDFKNGQYKMISFFAKKARGIMARYIIDNRITEPEALKSFAEAGYYYSEAESKGDQWVFLRDEAPA